MPEERPTRFKSRFSLLSLLPARHPPLQPNPPPLPTKQSLPPTQFVKSRHPTVVSIDGNESSPVQSEYPLSAYTNSPPILPPSAPFAASSRASVESPSPDLIARSPASTSGSARTKSSARSGHRPPPLDLRRTKQAYPGVAGIIPTAGTVAPQDLGEENVLVMAPEAKTGRRKEKERKASERQQKKERKLVDDPFEIAEVEPGHRYASWRGGKVSIEPGQVLPTGALEIAPTSHGIDPDDLPSRTTSRNAALERLERSKSFKSNHLAAPDMYDSVLHDVLLTPTYLRHSPVIPPTPSPRSSHREGWREYKPNKRRTIVEALRRGSTMLRWNEHDRSMRESKDREAQEMARFRQAVRPVRFAENPVVGYSSSPRWTQLGSATMRRSPASREWGVGLTFGEGKRYPGGGKSWREGKEKEKMAKRQKTWKVSHGNDLPNLY